MRWVGRWQLSFVALAVIWGCSFWWIKLGLTFLHPVEVAFGRLLVGALTLLTVSAAARVRLPRSRQTWRHLAVVALLLNSVPFTLFAIGETQVSSVLAGILNATTPLAALLVILVAYPEEQPSRGQVLGLGIGFVGVLVVLNVWQGFDVGQGVGIVACLAAVACYGVAFPYARRNLTSTGESPLALASGQVLLGAGFLLPLVVCQALLAPPDRGEPSVGGLLGMLSLGCLGSGLAYVLNFRIIAAVGAATASAVTYLTPVFAVVVGASMLGEPVRWSEPIGTVIVLVGVAMSQGRVQRWSRARWSSRTTSSSVT